MTSIKFFKATNANIKLFWNNRTYWMEVQGVDWVYLIAIPMAFKSEVLILLCII